ncbi:MAG: carboxypeptidase-like regulatory domain-containing protein [Terriglobales bacterium]
MSARGSGTAKPKPYALIFGTVWDPEGRPLYGVKVKIRRTEDKKARWELYSNHTGEFAQRLPVGKADYVVWADVKDYKLESGEKLKPGSEVTVHIDRDERSDIGLHLDW